MSKLFLLVLLTILSAAFSSPVTWKKTVAPTMVRHSIGDTGHMLYSFCVPAEMILSPESVYDFSLKFEWSNKKQPHVVIIDWDYNGRGADLKDFAVTDKPVSLHAKNDLQMDWQLGENPALSGLIVANGEIKSITFEIEGQNIRRNPHVKACSLCATHIDSCNVCGGENVCEYPVGCDGIPLSGSTKCEKPTDKKLKDELPQSHTGCGMFQLLTGANSEYVVVFVVLLTVSCTICTTCAVLSADRRRRKQAAQAAAAEYKSVAVEPTYEASTAAPVQYV